MFQWLSSELCGPDNSVNILSHLHGFTDIYDKGSLPEL